MDQVPTALYGQNGPWVAPRQDRLALDLEPTVWVDDSWTGPGDCGGHNWGVDAFASIQGGIDAVAAGGTVNVYPGTYAEIAPGSILFDASGPYQFGLFVADDKSGITIQGVTAGGAPITSYAGVLATVSLYATNNFGYSGMFIEGDNVTVTGLDLYQITNHNKSIEVIGDNLTFKWNKITDGNSLYFNDWRVNTAPDPDVSHVQTYLVEGNLFDVGTSVDIASGAGFSGPVSGRQIINNRFEMDWPSLVDYWAAISFNGSGTGVPWFVFSTGAAVITGNTFVYAEGFYIRHRGTFTNPADFDWVSYWNDNTFDKKVAFGPNPPTTMGTYSYPNYYGTFTDVKEIGANIQREIDWSVAGDVVLAGAGTYAEWDIAINKAITLRGAGVSTIIDASSYTPPDASHRVIGIDLPIGNVTIEQLKVNNSRIYGITTRGNTDPSSVITIDNVEIEGYGYNNDPTPGKDFGIIAGYGQTAKVVVSNCNLHDTYQNVMLFEQQLGETDIHHNTITDAYTVFYMTYNSAHVTTLQKFHHNTLNGGEIYFNSASQYYAPTTAGKYANIEVSDNTFNNIETGMRAMGAGNDNGVTPADGEIVAPRFLRNTVNGISGGTNYRGLQLLGYISDARVENNYIHDVDVGVRVWTFYAPGIYPVGTKIYHNSIKNCGSDALRWDGPGDINASVNWWGAAPVWASIFTGSVDYTPWCQLDGTYNNPGFTPNLSQLQVEALSPQMGLVNRIQEGINMTVGSTVNVATGTYEEQVHITTNNLNLVGAGVGSTFIQAPNSMPLYFTTSANNFPVIFVDGATGVSLSNLTVDGLSRGNTNYRFQGIGYWNAGGSISSVTVTNIKDTPFSGAQHGVGIYAFNNTAGPYTLSLTNVTVNNYQKGGLALNGSDDLTVTANNVTATGIGWTPVTAQNGIQLWGSGGTLTNCTVTGNGYDGASWASGGFLLIQGPGVTLTNCTATGNQIGVFDNDATLTVNGGTFTGPSAPTTATYWAGIADGNETAGLSMTRPPVQLFGEGPTGNDGAPLDAPGDDALTVTGATITGIAGNTGYGVDAYSTVDNLSATVSGSTVAGWEYGVSLDQWYSGTTASSSVSGNILNNTTNGYDDRTAYVAGRWSNNCYWDYGPSHAGYPSYNITGGPQVDTNPNPTCSTEDLVLFFDDPYVGCAGGPSCTVAVLKVVFTDPNFRGGHLVITLPTGIVANFATCPAQYNGTTLIPGGQVSTNLQTSLACGTGSTITLDVFWSGSGSTGAPNQYIAWLPVINSTATNGTYPVAIASYDYWDVSNVHYTSGFDFALPDLYVDCIPPTTTLTGGAGESGCDSYNSAAEFANQLTYTITNAGSPASALSSAQIVLTNSNSPGSPYTYPVSTTGGTFPPVAVWADMAEGCNTFTLTATDAACNTSIPVSVTVEKDTQGPAVTGGTYTVATCHNDISGDPQYGATLLDANLDIDITDADICGAGSTFDFALSVTVNNTQNVLAYDNVLSVTDYPSAAEALTLWTAIVAAINNINYSGSVTVNWTATDCAGNTTTGSFTINCVDFLEPANQFTLFDARPTSNGVWLKWTWTIGDAVEAKIFRTGEVAYPVYGGNLWMTDGNYEKVYTAALSGWTLVATVTGGQSSTAFTGAPDIHGGPGLAYWKDATAGPRDIYRYITFVKDAGGNWSQVGSYIIGTNADRSTNYWLGDYPLPDPGSIGIVNNTDLNALAQDYFETTIAGSGTAQNYIDIGPENEENGVGKGIPNPDQAINFLDLIPFSFNFGVVLNGGFNTQTPRVNPAEGPDTAPVVTVARADNNLLEVGDEFEVVVRLSGNSNSAVKAVEAELTFDPQVLELVEISGSSGEVYDGIGWSTAKQIAGSNDRVGIAVAALGEIASFVEDFTMATVTFRWIADHTPETSMQLESYHILDVFGRTDEGEGPTLNFGASGVIPTVYALYQNYPNPFNPSTLIRLDLPEAADVQLVIYNVMGQEVRTLVSATMPAGAHAIAWNGLDNSGRMVGSGMYIYRVSAGPLHDIKKMLLTR